MEVAQPPPAAAPKGRRMSVSVDEWTVEKSKLVSKLMCLKGTTAYKFAREKIMKKKWQNPALKTLLSPQKGFIVWTGRKPVRFTNVAMGPSDALDLLMAATDLKVLMDAGIGGAKHCIFHVHVQGDDGQPDIVDFAVETPVIARQWVDGLSMLLHTGSVGIGLQVKQSAGKFIVVLALDGSPSAACGQFNNGDVIETVDTQPLTDRTTFAEYEALVLGPDNSPISITLNRGGKKMEVKLRRGATVPPK